jgi:dolichyl-phosphate-mannose--protein O-mannosyl transferase
MKCEGVFAAGKFRALKVYRLYQTSVEARQAGESEQQVQAVYTRNKGINRWLASQLSDEAFDSNYLDKVTVHRTALRPNRTGEILMVHESRSMTTPFNLKRLVDVSSNGLHSYPLSFGVPNITHEEAEEIVSDMTNVAINAQVLEV